MLRRVWGAIWNPPNIVVGVFVLAFLAVMAYGYVAQGNTGLGVLK